MPRQLSRYVEAYAVMLEDIPHSREWLLRIAEKTEQRFLDLGIQQHLSPPSLIFQTSDAGTVVGYRRIDLIQRIRDEIQRNVESDAAAVFLQKMCHRRLLPTPWLNKVHRIHHILAIQHTTEAVSQGLREPLYLKDVPVTIEDRRSEEQIKYPEFFQHVLSPP